MALMQLGTIALSYVRIYYPESPILPPPAPTCFFARYAVYFPLGIVFGFHLQRMKQWLVKVKWGLLSLAILFAFLTLVEQEYLYRNTALIYGATFPSLSSFFYTNFFILCYLAFANVEIPLSKWIYQIANKSYGIYLVHPLILALTAKSIYHIAPWMLKYQAIFQPLLIVVGIGMPLLLMKLVLKTPAKKTYRYLFG
jgi:surface polysaccharide O-acyltransferase-like enzyme